MEFLKNYSAWLIIIIFIIFSIIIIYSVFKSKQPWTRPQKLTLLGFLILMVGWFSRIELNYSYIQKEINDIKIKNANIEKADIKELTSGLMVLPQNSIINNLIDIPITTKSPSGIISGYSFSIDGKPILGIFAESTGQGNSINPQVKIFGDLILSKYGDQNNSNCLLIATTSICNN